MQQYAFPDDSAWSRCLAQFLKTCSPSGSAKTQREYRITLTYFLSHPAKMPENYTQEDVHTFLYAPSRSPRNPGSMPSIATVNVRLAILKSWYSFAAAYTVEGADGHPTPLLKAVPPTFGMKAGRSSSHAKAFSFEDLQKLFSVIPSDVRGLRDKAIFMCLFWSCRRRSEIANLHFGDIECATIVDNGQRRESYIYHFKNKGDVGMDAAELPLPAKKAIDAYLLASGRIHTIQPENPLWIPINGNGQSKALTSTSMARSLKLYCKKAGLSSCFSLHSFRHAGSRARYEAGSDIREIQQLLRHSSLSTTDIYLRTLTGTSDPGAKLLEAKYGHL